MRTYLVLAEYRAAAPGRHDETLGELSPHGRLWEEIGHVETGDPETAIRTSVARLVRDYPEATLPTAFAAVPSRNWTERSCEVETEPRIKLTVPEPQSMRVEV